MPDVFKYMYYQILFGLHQNKKHSITQYFIQVYSSVNPQISVALTVREIA
jgi:hypothetical protein